MRTLRSDWLLRRQLGRPGEPAPGCLYPTVERFLEFVECHDVSPPTQYALDVKKTDSVLYPYLGVITVPVSVDCVLSRIAPKGFKAWNQKSIDEIAPDCIGKTLATCLGAGKTKRAPTVSNAACTGGPGFAFHYDDVDVVTYRWSQGRWEFQEEKPPPAIPDKGSPIDDDGGKR